MPIPSLIAARENRRRELPSVDRENLEAGCQPRLVGQAAHDHIAQRTVHARREAEREARIDAVALLPACDQ